MEEVIIGSQIWMVENLDVSKFRNGDAIPEVKTNEEWEKAGKNKQPAWCYYDNDPKKGIKYGKLYNWYAVNDARGLAPEGWRVPSDLEWTQLTNFLGGIIAGYKMKKPGEWRKEGLITICPKCSYWTFIQRTLRPCEDCRNTREVILKYCGFSAKPGGLRGARGLFKELGWEGLWWSNSNYDIDSAYGRHLARKYGNFDSKLLFKACGFSVRCLRDFPISNGTDLTRSETIANSKIDLII